MLRARLLIGRCGSFALLLLLTGAALAQGVSDDGGVRTRRLLEGRRISGIGPASPARSLDAARRQHQVLLAVPRATNLSAAWTPIGPNQVATAAFGKVTGRVTSIAIDPADAAGNTVYVGTTGGGVWKSTNAAGPAGSVSFVPLTDTLPVFSAGGSTVPSLSIGAIAVMNGVVLAGTGDPSDATDSYYGAGILRSADAGATWTLAQGSQDGVAGNHTFFGLSVAGMAFSSANPSLVVAALSQAVEGTIVNAGSTQYSQTGIVWSSDAGVTWHAAALLDGSQPIQSPALAGVTGNIVTAVVWNPIRQRFYAAVQAHGYYESADGTTFTRMAHQPGAGLTAAACPTIATAACPIFRGALAVQPASGDTFALTVDPANRDQGLFRDACALNGTSCASTTVLFGTALNAAPLESNAANHIIAQGDYNLTLAAVPSGTDTLLYVGTIDLYRCSLAQGCTLRNTTDVQNGCANPAGVAPAQHALAVLPLTAGPLLYIGNDGGLWRSTDGVNQQAAPCSLDDANHFQNLNASLGSLAEVVSFAQAPADAGTLLAGLGALGTAGTGTVTNTWPQLAAGEGGTVAIDPRNPALWYISAAAGVSVARCTRGAGCTAADFASPVIGPAQTANDIAAIHAPWLLDPGLASNLIIGTCRAWRGPATGGALWSASNAISRPFEALSASACSPTLPVVRSLAAGGFVATGMNAQNAGSEVLYAGLAGSADGGRSPGGKVFVTSAANLANNTTTWTDAAKSPVINDPGNAGAFNPGGFDVSSIAVDPHDATGNTVYATVMGFAGNGINAPHLYRSVDAGAHWTNISSNLPNAPANSVVVDPNDANTLYAALDTGVYVATAVTNCTTANCWSVFGSALPNAPVVQLLASANVPTGDGRLGELRAATYGRGIWQIPLLTATSPAAPFVAINPSAVTYVAQQIGTQSPSVTITVANTGSAALLVSRVATTGDYAESDNCVGTAIAQNATCTAQVTFSPTATGIRTGLLTVYANIAGGQATVAFTGIGTAAATVVLTPASLTFTPTSVGATSAPQSLTISNTGGTSAKLQAPVVSGDFFLAANTCGFSLGAGTGCTVSIQFAPTTSGTRSGTLTVTDDAGVQVAGMLGIGTNPATDALSPVSLSFAAQPLNSTSPTQQVTLTNAGDVALTLIAAQITSGNFTVVNGCGTSLNPHANCTFSVAFVPKSIGAQTGGLTISDQFRSQTVSLSGLGLAPPGVSLSPLSGIAFGAVGVGLTAPAQTVTLTNNGGVPLTIASIAATGDFAIATGTNTCGPTLAPAAVCTVGIIFLPTLSGPRTGTVTFTDNAGNSPQTLPLVGVGIDFALSVNGPATLSIASGDSATYSLFLTSVVGLPGAAAFTCAGLPAHAVCTVNPVTVALGGSSSITVTVATGILTGAVTPPSMPWTRQAIWFAVLLPLLAARRRKCVGALLLLVAIAGCSAARTVPSSGGTGAVAITTPSGTYPIVVSASSAGLVRSVNLALVVK